MDEARRQFLWHQVDLLRGQASSLESRGAIFLATQTIAVVWLADTLYNHGGRLEHGWEHAVGLVALAALVVGLISAGEMVLPGRHALPDMLGLRRRAVPDGFHDGLNLPLPELSATTEDHDAWLEQQRLALQWHLGALYASLVRAALSTGVAAMVAGIALFGRA